MANKDAAFGLRPARMMGGAPYSGGQSRYRIASGYAGVIFQGDLVKQVTGGGGREKGFQMSRAWRIPSGLGKR